MREAKGLGRGEVWWLGVEWCGGRGGVRSGGAGRGGRVGWGGVGGVGRGGRGGVGWAGWGGVGGVGCFGGINEGRAKGSGKEGGRGLEVTTGGG